MSFSYDKYSAEVLAVTCKRCGRGLLRRCADNYGRQTAPHAVRLRAAKEAEWQAAASLESLPQQPFSSQP